MFSKGKQLITIEEIKSLVSEVEIASYYLGITKLPCIICSPLRVDKHPSFGVYSPNGDDVNYIDFGNISDKGTIYSLLMKLWGLSFNDTLYKIYEDFYNMKYSHSINTDIQINKYCKKQNKVLLSKTIDLRCKVREWKDYDIKYWESYGISLPWLKYANVYPISHKIIVTNKGTYVFGVDKYAYAFVEFKDKVSIKIYQPFNTKGFKWTSGHNKSVISLWTKIPDKGDKLCICSSLKDALCMWSNTGIPSIALQGEGYPISKSAIKVLKARFTSIYIIFDNDEAGIKGSEKLAEATGFTNIILPVINEAKDISDIYFKLKDKKAFKNIILNLFN